MPRLPGVVESSKTNSSPRSSLRLSLLASPSANFVGNILCSRQGRRRRRRGGGEDDRSSRVKSSSGLSKRVARLTKGNTREERGRQVNQWLWTRRVMNSMQCSQPNDARLRSGERFFLERVDGNGYAAVGEKEERPTAPEGGGGGRADERPSDVPFCGFLNRRREHSAPGPSFSAR